MLSLSLISVILMALFTLKMTLNYVRERNAHKETIRKRYKNLRVIGSLRITNEILSNKIERLSKENNELRKEIAQTHQGEGSF